MIYSQKSEEFLVKQGPVFANFVLADEINRTPAKMQSALLEAMQERQVKYFVILFVALTLFYVGIDILTNLKSMPASANLKLLYFGLTSLTAVNYVLPLSLIFALKIGRAHV